DPLADGTCPAEHAERGAELQHWIAPRRGPPLTVLDGRTGADGYPIEFAEVVRRGSPFVSVTIDVRASDEEIAECVRVIRAHVGVSIARTRASRTFWGKQLGPVVARDYWVRARDPAAPRDIAARLARERLQALGLDGKRLDARDPALLEMKRVLRNLFSRMDDAVRVDPWRPYRWGAAYAVRGTVRSAVPWFVQAVEDGADGEAVT
ncbi:MAG: hypothetical protein K8T90_22765, partial [Planctomycetes bacterium]|nr:hypothetical protein [Planctomycetota bacterium]